MKFLVKSMLSIAVVLVLSLASAGAETKLIMFEEEGCVWCETWHSEVGSIYEKTPEGQQAALVLLDIHDPIPEHYSLNSGAVYTPTFVLVDDGVEVGRIEGYPGNGFFWGLLDMMLEKLGG